MSASEGGWDNVVLELIQNKADICVKDRTQVRFRFNLQISTHECINIGYSDHCVSLFPLVVLEHISAYSS